MLKRPSWVATVFAVILTVVIPSQGIAASEQDQQDLHILNRLTLGPTQETMMDLKTMGPRAWIDQQLHPDQIAEDPQLLKALATLPTLTMSRAEVFVRYQQHPRTDDPVVRAANEARRRIPYDEAVTARIWRGLYSRRQLQEVMVDFWSNHFNIFANKGLDRLWIEAFENQTIRPYALGRFRDLLGATAHDPAMLTYLDNTLNTGQDSAGRQVRGIGINENYAREVMELHTLGVNGGYTQTDVTALAHVLSGLGVAAPRHLEAPGGWWFARDRHDFDQQVVLGSPIQGIGEAGIEEALDRLAASPATAHHLAFELAQYFVADAPPKTLVDQLTARWIATDGQIGAVLETLFTSPEFSEAAYTNNKIKTPWGYVLSCLRISALPVGPVAPINRYLAQMGEPLYGHLMPDGYANTQAAWLDSDALNQRVSIAIDVAMRPRRIPEGVWPRQWPAQPHGVDAQGMLALLDPILSPHTKQIVAQAPPSLQAALLLGSPEFQRH